MHSPGMLHQSDMVEDFALGPIWLSKQPENETCDHYKMKIANASQRLQEKGYDKAQHVLAPVQVSQSTPAGGGIDSPFCRVGDIVDIKANGAVQKGLVNSHLRWMREMNCMRSSA
jgi:hypothetical protein